MMNVTFWFSPKFEQQLAFKNSHPSAGGMCARLQVGIEADFEETQMQIRVQNSLMNNSRSQVNQAIARTRLVEEQCSDVKVSLEA